MRYIPVILLLGILLYLTSEDPNPDPNPNLNPNPNPDSSLFKEAYASHTDCITQSNNTDTSSYYSEECWYYDRNERPIRHTVITISRYWGSGTTETRTNITETWSYYSNGLLAEECYRFFFTHKARSPGYSADRTVNQEDCKRYDEQGRLVWKEKVSEDDNESCNASGCRDRETKNNRTDTYVYRSGRVYQHCYTIDNRYYNSASSTTDNKYYLAQCNQRAEWTERHYGRDIPVRTWLTSGYERIDNYWSGSSGNDRETRIKTWYDTQTRRIYTNIYMDRSYSFSGCCSGYGTIQGTGWDSLCYPYAIQEQNYFIRNGIPTGNEDGTFYRNDQFRYEAIMVLLRNDPQYPCRIVNAEPSADSSQYLSITACYDTFYQVCRKGDVTIASNTPYGEHSIIARVEYEYPYYRYWTTYYWCSNWECRNEAPNSVFGYATSYFNVLLATARVVPYDPVFLVYPYLSIADLNRWSYDKQLSLAVHYLGSKDIDGNIYPDRRVVMNKTGFEAYAYQIRKGYGLPPVDPSDTIQQLPSLTRIEYKVKITQCYDPNTIAYRSTDSDPYHEEIAILKSAYFVLDLHYMRDKPSDIILNLMNYQLADLTVRGILKTEAGTIGGEDTLTDKDIGSFEYVYPARSFLRSVSLRVVAENAQGNLVPLQIYRIKVEFIPQTGQGYWDLHSYLRAKYNYDIAMKNNGVPNPFLVELIYCVENADNAYRPIIIERYNTSMVAFLDRFHMLYLPDSALRVFQVDHMLQIPLQYALQASTPMKLKITIQTNPLQPEISNVYALPAYQQYSTYQQDIFLGFGIWTDKHVKRYGDKIVVTPPTHFKIHSMEINSSDFGNFAVNNCMIGCTVEVGKGSVLAVIHNEWNALALAYFPALVENPIAEEDPYIGWTMFAVTVAVSFVVMMLLRYFRRQIQ